VAYLRFWGPYPKTAITFALLLIWQASDPLLGFIVIQIVPSFGGKSPDPERKLGIENTTSQWHGAEGEGTWRQTMIKFRFQDLKLCFYVRLDHRMNVLLLLTNTPILTLMLPTECVFIKKMAITRRARKSLSSPQDLWRKRHLKRDGIKVYDFFCQTKLLVEYPKVPYFRMVLYYMTEPFSLFVMPRMMQSSCPLGDPNRPLAI
jgi:hypothetical protein